MQSRAMMNSALGSSEITRQIKLQIYNSVVKIMLQMEQKDVHLTEI